MPDLNLKINPTNYQAVSGKTWQVTGLRVDNNYSSNCLFTDSKTGTASGYYFSQLGTESTGIYATSGQFDNPDLRVSWSLVHPRNDEILGEEALRDPFFKSYEINIRNIDGTFKTGINYINDGRITAVDLISGGSGYINPTVFISGDGTGAAIEVQTLGTGTYSSLSGFANIGVSGYATGIHSVNVVSGGSGYTAANTKLVISGEGNDAHTIGDMALPILGGDGVTTSGSGAYLAVASTGFGLRQGYHMHNYIDIPQDLNKEIFGGEGQRKFMVEVITNDFYDQTSTGRIIVDFPSPQFQTANILDTKRGLSFGITPSSGQVFENQIFEDISLEKIEIHRSASSDFSIKTGDVFTSTLFHTFRADSRQDRLSSLSELDIPLEAFHENDFFSGYYYKFLPYDKFGTGKVLEVGTGIRIERHNDPVDIPSGFRLITDDDKAVGTNIQGQVVTNTYLSWKKDVKFNTNQYEVTIEDQVEKDSHTIILNPPQISGIDFLISGTGVDRADFDEKSAAQIGTEGMPKESFDIFSPYSTNGIQWIAHTVFLDSEYLSTVSNSINNVDFVEVPAGNTNSGYLYFTGLEGKTINYAASNNFLLSTDNAEPHALVARNVNNEVVVEYEPRIKIPTTKDGSYNFKVRGINSLGEKSNYSNIVNFTASGAPSHFTFDPLDTSLKIGGTGTITKSGPFVTTVGGSGITAVGTGVVVVGGVNNRVTGELSALVGGSGNRILGAVGRPGEASFLGGGRENYISGNRNVLVGGDGNLVSGDGQALVGGLKNIIFGSSTDSSSGSLQIGNPENIEYENSIIGGGNFNVLSGDTSFIGGGYENTIGIDVARSANVYGENVNSQDWTKKAARSLNSSAIVGGRENQIFGSFNFIGGGRGNQIFEGGNTQQGAYSVIAGGQDNIITGTTTARSIILGGKDNINAGVNSIVGGIESTGQGNQSLALGSYGWAAHDGAFVLADSSRPDKVAGHYGHKKSLTANSLNLFFDNGTYVRNGDLYVSGDATISGDLKVSGSFTLGDATTDSLDSFGAISSTGSHISGLSGYFGKVGIGTTLGLDSNVRLLVTETTASTDSIVRIQAGEAADAFLDLYADDGDDNADKWRIKSTASNNNLEIINNSLAGGGQAVVIDSAGKVGIGTTSPSEELQIYSTASAPVSAIIETNQDQEASLKLKNSQGEWEIKADNGADAFRIADVGTASRFSIEKGGQVGIGGTGQHGALFTVHGDTSITGELRVNRSGLFVGGNSNTNAIVGIGTTSPQFTLDVQFPNRISASAEYAWGLDLRRPGSTSRGLSFGAKQTADDWVIGSHNANIRLGHTFGTDAASMPKFYEDLSIFHQDAIHGGGKIAIGDFRGGAPQAKLVVSGDTSITGELRVAGDGEFATDLYVADNLRHLGDSDTRIVWGDDRMRHYAGSVEMIDIREAGADYVAIGGLSTASSDVNFFVNSAGAGGTDYAFAVDAGDSSVGININPANAKGSALVVSGDASITGQLKVSGTSTAESGHLSVKGSGYFADGIVFGDGTTQTTASAGGGGGGAVSAVANGADNRVATFSSSDALNGEANLTFDGTRFTVDGDASITGELRARERSSIGAAAPSSTRQLTLYNNDSNRGLLIQHALRTQYAEAHFQAQASSSTTYQYRVGVGGDQSVAPLNFYVYDVNKTQFRFNINADGETLIGEGVSQAGALLTVSGDASITGELRVAGDARVASDVHVGTDIIHDSDPDTYVRFNTDRIRLFAGGVELIDGREAGTDYVAIGGLSTVSSDVNFFVNSAGAGGTDYAFAVDAGASAVGINCDPLDAPGSALVVSGDASVTGELRVGTNVQVGQTIALDADSVSYITGGNLAVGTTTSDNALSIVMPAADSSNLFDPNISDTNAALSVFKAFQGGPDDSDVEVGRFGSARARYGATSDWAGHLKFYTNHAVTTPSFGYERFRLTWDAGGRGYFGATSNKTVGIYAGVNKVQITSDGAQNTTPQATLVVSGDASITGELKVNGEVHIPNNLVHKGDTDTYLNFNDDRIRLNAGGVELIDAREAGADYVAIGGVDDNPDVNFLVGSAVNGIDYVVEVDAGSSAVGINCDPLDAKGAALVVSGSASVTGELRTNGSLGVGAPNGGALLDPLHISAGNPRIRLEDTLGTNNYSRILADNGQLTLSADEGENQAGSAIIFKVDNNEIMRMDDGAEGQVGIGTSPAHILEVYSSAPVINIKDGGAYTTNATPYLQFSDYNNYISRIGKLDNSNSVGLDLQTNSGHIHLNPAGNVGIGTTNPGNLLDVDKDQQAATYVNVINSTNHANSQAGVRIDSNTSNNFLLAHADSRTLTRYGVAIGGYAELLSSAGNGLLIGTSTLNKPIIFGTQSAERMRIGGDGNVGIATTAPTGKLHIYQSGDSQPAFLVEGSQGSLFSVEDTLTGSLMSVNDIAGLPVFEAFDDGTIVMGQYNSGDLVVTGNKVGIGTTNPSEKFHVKGADTSLAFDLDNGSLATLYEPSNNSLAVLGFKVRISTNGNRDNVRLVVDNNGLVGINPDGGISYNPSSLFEVYKGDSKFQVDPDNNRIRLRDHSYVSGNLYVSGSQVLLSQGTQLRFYDSNRYITDEGLNIKYFSHYAGHKFYAGPSSPVILEVNPNGQGTRLRDDVYVSGNLHVSGSIITADGTSPDHISGLSGYFGKVGIGTTQMGANAKLVIQNGNVGIGTSSPEQALHVNSAGTNFVAKFESTDDKASILIEDDTTLNYIHSRNGYFSLGGASDAGATNLTIISAGGSAGRVGIGVTSPEAKLQVSGDASITGDLSIAQKIVHGGDTDTFIQMLSNRIILECGAVQLMDARNAGSDYVAIGGLSTVGADVNFFVNSAGAGGTDYAFAVDAGLSAVGINVEPSDAKGSALVVSGDASISGGLSTEYAGGALNGISVKGTANRAKIVVSDNDTSAYMIAEDALASFGRQDHLDPANINISNGGNVGIGTTNPEHTLHVKKDIDDFVVKIENDGNAAAAGGLHLDTRWNVEGNYPLKVTTNSEAKSLFAIDAIGRVLIGGGVGGDLSAMSTLGANTLLNVSGDASITGELRVNRSGLFVKGSATENVSVGIGTTSPGSLLEVRESQDNSASWWTNASSQAVLFNNNTTAGAACILKLQTRGGAGNNARIIYGGNGTTDKLIFSSRVTEDYNVFANAGRFACFDARSSLGLGTLTPEAKLQVSGDASITGELKVSDNVLAETYRSSRSDGDIYIQAATSSDFVSIGNQSSANLFRIDSVATQVTGDLRVAELIRHGGDTNTHIQFTSDRIQFTAGGDELMDIREAGTDYVAIGGLSANGDVNFIVNSAVNGIDRVLEVDAGTSTVGINCDPLDAKGAALVVSGDASITGQLVVGGGQTAESIKLLRQSDTNPYISWYSDISTREAYIQGSPSHFYIVNQNNNNIELMTNGAVNFTVSPTETFVRQDFRVAGSAGMDNLFFVDKSTNLVGFGTNSPSPSYTVTVSGGLAADYKSFIIDHPDPAKPDKQLAYASSETPEHNVFVRGKAQSKIIELPDHWPYLVHEDSISVQLTPIGEHQELYVESIKDNKILINNSKENKINCFYLVHAERKDIGKLEIEPDKSVNKDKENGE